MKTISSKLVSEVRFRPNLNYYDEMFKITSSIESDYDDWNATHNPSLVQLIDNNKRKLLSVSSNSVSVLTENESLLASIESETRKMFALFLEPTNVNRIRRFGVRRMAIMQSNLKYSDLAEKFYKAFYSNTDYFSNLAADKVEDVAFILDGIKDGQKTHVRVGPLLAEQKNMYFQPEFDKENLDASKSHIYVDVDVFSDIESDLEAYRVKIETIFKLTGEIFEGVAEKCQEGLGSK